MKFTDIEEYCKDRFGKSMPLLKMMWQKVVASYIVTFDSIRKLVHIHHWAREYIRRNYDMIFIDEAQDFDDLMLDVLLKDTDIPKLFVGDKVTFKEAYSLLDDLTKLRNDSQGMFDDVFVAKMIKDAQSGAQGFLETQDVVTYFVDQGRSKAFL